MKIQASKNQGFTLVEILIVILILSLVSFATYLPYAHHQKKVLLDQGVREVSQVLSATRNKALHGYAIGGENNHTYIELVPGSELLHTYTLPAAKDSLGERGDKSTDTDISLPVGVRIHTVDGSTVSKTLIFDAISGTLQSPDTLGDTLDIVLSYKGSDHVSLQEDLIYYTGSYITDY